MHRFVLAPPESGHRTITSHQEPACAAPLKLNLVPTPIHSNQWSVFYALSFDFLRCNINEIIYNVTFWDGPLSLSIMPLIFI